jgi:cytochrome c553
MRFQFSALLGAAWVLTSGHSTAALASPDLAGQQIYRQGSLPTGAELTGSRDSGTSVTGGTAACVSCHRRSGLGNVEGDIIIPPIIAKYLYRSRAVNTEDLTLPHVPGWVPHSWTYTDETLARAIRTGVRPDGQGMNPLMPHYALDDASMAALISYLKELTSQPVPGVTDTTLHFATIVTPDADPVEKKAMLEVLNRFFAIQEKVIAAESRPMRASREIMYRVTRRWQLHVWELAGAPDTWERQLDEHLAVEPVFAVISGLGRREWHPIHRFCEHNAVPCLLPNIDLPVVSEHDFYPVYYSRGVLLEADLIAARLMGDTAPHAARLVQVYRPDDIGAAAADDLEARARALGLPVVRRPLNPASKHSGVPIRGDLDHAFADVGPGDALILWLRPADLTALRGRPPTSAVYASGLMAGLESAPVPAAWRAATHLTYPFDTPDQRRVRMNFPLGWFKVQGIAVTAERIQADTYLSCVILSEVLGHMLDSFVRDFLLERTEMMLSRRLVNGYYPRLGLAQGQRFASKGGYLVHLADANGKLMLDSDWITP